VVGGAAAEQSSGMTRKTPLPVLLVAWALVGPLDANAAPAPSESCGNAAVPAAEQAVEDFDASVFCLINRERREFGRRALRPNGLLRRAALDYATSMEAGGFFSHYGDFFGHPIGATPVSRLRQIGYIRSHDVWMVGENLHWTTADLSTPADVVQAWVRSPMHLKYLLKGRFRDLGVATVRGTPYDPAQTDAITVASEYGFRDS
jgi:uncharacterized protein YkwD